METQMSGLLDKHDTMTKGSGSKSMKILIIDDEQISITLLQYLVRKMPGCEPITFTDSVLALAWSLDNEPDLVVVDYNMPHLNGMELTEKFRVRHPGIPVLMVTADFEPKLRIRALELGVTDFLNKPLDIVEFLARSKNMLALRQSHKHRLVSLGTLAAGMAHDFNNQMAMVMGYVELLKATVADANSQKTLNVIMQVLERSTGTVSKLTVLGSNALDRSEWFCMATLLSKEYRLLMSSFEGFKLTLLPIEGYHALIGEGQSELVVSELPALLYGSFGDKSAFSQVLANLCSNAAKHAFPGRKEGHIILSLERVPNEKKMCLKIEDNGCGMPPEVLDRIYEPYFTTGVEADSSGLGLFIVQGIITCMGGEISCESEVGKGTVFSITLPVHDA